MKIQNYVYPKSSFLSAEKDMNIIQEVMETESKKYTKECVVEFLPLDNFYPAEDYHQKYLEKNPNGYCHIDGCFFHLN